MTASGDVRRDLMDQHARIRVAVEEIKSGNIKAGVRFLETMLLIMPMPSDSQVGDAKRCMEEMKKGIK